MKNLVKNDFLRALSSKTTGTGYRAHLKLGNGKIGITAVYTREVLKAVVKEAQGMGHILVRISREDL